jgi:hypothetical protein
MSDSAHEIRTASPDDAAALREAFGDARPFRRLFEGDPQVVIILALRDGAPSAAMAAETSGHPVNAEWAWISAMFISEGVAAEEVAPGLYGAAEEAIGSRASAGGSATVLAAPVEVGDRTTERLLEAAGFRPSGGPYRAIGPGMVEYLDGYTDPQGFQVDFVRELG